MSGNRPRRRGSRRTGTLYCTDCGDPLDPSMNYCPSCGVATGYPNGNRSSSTVSAPSSGIQSRPTASGADRGHPATAGTTDRERLERRIAAASRNGWRLERDFGDHAVVVRRTVGSVTGHLLVALVTVWWTMGIGNVLYGAYRYVDGTERMVVRGDRIDGGTAGASASATDPDDTTAESTGFRRATATLGWLLAAIAAWLGVQLGAGATGSSTASLVLFASALGFAVVGTSVLPSVSRRLDDRRSVLTNGRIRSVEERTVTATATPCTVCAKPVDRGLERTYRAELCVLGIPVTGTEGRNYYCRACANAESSATGTSDYAAVTEPVVDGPPTDSTVDTDSESDSDRA